MTEFRKILPSTVVTGVSQSFLITSAGLQVLRGKLIDIPELETEESIGTSMLNTAVIDNIVFKSGSYFDLEGNEIEYDELRIDTVIIEVTQAKNIVKTKIQGRDVSVKEHVSDDDYIINIRGIIQSADKNEQNKYPLELSQNLITICKAKRSLVVTSTFLNEVFEIEDIVIERYNIPQIEGVRNQQAFSITASSDVPVDLEELEI